MEGGGAEAGPRSIPRALVSGSERSVQALRRRMPRRCSWRALPNAFAGVHSKGRDLLCDGASDVQVRQPDD